MVSVEKMETVVQRQRQIRNMSVIAHVDHGKTTLTDSLLSRAGMLGRDQAGAKCATDTRLDEQLRGITIKSTAVSLYYSVSASKAKWLRCLSQGEETEEFLINLIDCPGHVDFSSEVTAALRVTDGAMVVVDCISGVCVQTETVLRQALSELVRPVLMMNKMDRSILERQLEPEELYQHLERIINNVNSQIFMYSGEEGIMGDISLDPRKGNVAFGSGLHGWGFSLPQFAHVYAQKTGQEEEKLLKKLWGNNYYNPATKKWSNAPKEGFVRGFNKFVLEPIYKMLEMTLACKINDCVEMAKKIGVQLCKETLEECEGLGQTGGGKLLMKTIMRRWLPAGDAMLHMILDHLPDPVTSQKYRVQSLYEGPMDDEAALGMTLCDPSGPLMIYISKMLPSHDKSRFFAFGRIFSGSIKSGVTVRIQGPDYVPGQTKDLYSKTITGVKLPTVSGMLSVGMVPCGNVVALAGIDKCLRKSGTVTNYLESHNFKVMKFSVSPVVRVAVDVIKSVDRPRLVKGLKNLEKAEPLVQCSMENGQHIVAGAGELHIEICLQDLENEFAGVPLKKSNPVVTYKETISEESSQPCLAKSGNKHNRLYVVAQPMPDGMAEAIEAGEITAAQDKKERARYIADKFGYDAQDMRKIWAFGPEGSGPNILVDMTKGQQNLADIKDAIVAGFQWATSEGMLCEQLMRGIRFNIVDAMVHSDPACRKGGQIIPMARRAFMASCLTASPRLVEPIYLVEIQTCSNVMGGIYSVLARSRGVIFEETPRPGTNLINVKAYLPVAESFGFADNLRGATGGQAFPQLVFDHWNTVLGDPMDKSSMSGAVVQQIRANKSIDSEIPSLDMFLDKL